MSHPYKKYAHTKDPKWVKGVEKFVEKAIAEDTDATIRNYGGDKAITDKATYQRKGK